MTCGMVGPWVESDGLQNPGKVELMSVRPDITDCSDFYLSDLIRSNIFSNSSRVRRIFRRES